MLMILFYLKNEPYCLKASHTVELVPLVQLKELPSEYEHLAGLMNYRGQIIPVLDLLSFFYGRPTEPSLSTKIIISSYQAEKEKKYLGLLAERMQDVLNKDTRDFIYTGLDKDECKYFNALVLHNELLLPCLDISILSRRFDFLEHFERGLDITDAQ